MTTPRLRPSSLLASLLLAGAGLLAAGCASHAPAEPQVAAQKPPDPLEEAIVDVAPPPSKPAANAQAAGSPARAKEELRLAQSARVANLALPADVAAEPGYAAPAPWPQAADTEHYASLPENGVVSVAQQPWSTFSIDVDTGSYANVRRFLNAGRLPPRDAVRVEELLNYFPYDYRPPLEREGHALPFGVTTEVAATPWNARTLLMRIGIKAYDKPRATLPPANLVFLVDVSGSMDEPAKLPLLKNALRLLVGQLQPHDHVSLVTYASGTRVVLPPTAGSEQARILAAIEGLSPGGSTAGAAGIELAYRMAREGYIADGINRILLATDGDFNVGITDFRQLKDMVAERRRGGVSLTTLGFGTGNYDEERMEQLADAGDGNYAYIDTLNEARKVLVEQLGSTLATVARDVKVQVEFNPATVAEYRLVGYENRALAREDFRNDKVDAGEIGAGHAVTALYEVTPAGSPGLLAPSRYAQAAAPAAGTAGELATVRLRYKDVHGATAPEIELPVAATPGTASTDLRFAAAVAAFGQQLRGGKYLGTFGYPEIQALAAGARGDDRFGYRGEFLRLVALAQALATPEPPVARRLD